MRLSSSIFTTGYHKHRFLICLLVSLWTHLLVVCGNDRPCTVCLILSRLCWCLMLTLTLVFSSALPWHTHTSFWLSLLLSCLFYMLLNHLFVASARLCFQHVHLHLSWVSIDFEGVMILFLCTWYPNANILRSAQITGSFTSVFRTLRCSLALVVMFYWSWGSYDPILCTLYPNTKILMCAQIMGSFSSFFRTLLCAYHNIFILVARRIIGLVGPLISVDCLLQLVSFDCLFLSLLCLCGISFICNLWASI